MTRRKREIVGLTNERDFPYLIELALPPGGFRSVFQEIDAFHRERRIPVRRGRSRYEVKQFYIRFPGEAQAADLGYVVGCTSREARSGGRLWQKEMAMIGKNRGMIYGPKTDRILAGVLTVASGGWIILILLGY